MAKASNMIPSKHTNPLQLYPSKAKSSFQIHRTCKINISAASRRRNRMPPMIAKRASRAPRRLVTVPTSTGGWPGIWTCDYLFSLKDLHLDDLAEDGKAGTEVSVSLCIQKHTGFGLSVYGRILTSIARKCSNCSSPYCNKIDVNFNVWVLPSGRDGRSIQIPEIGGDDPSVIYVTPGYEADLDSLIRDTIRLQISVKGTCSESCEKSEPKLHYIGTQRTASLDRRWARLLELRKSFSSMKDM